MTTPRDAVVRDTRDPFLLAQHKLACGLDHSWGEAVEQSCEVRMSLGRVYAAGLAAGRAAERAAVVAWLRAVPVDEEVGTIHDEIADDIVRAAHVPVDTKEGQE